MKTLAAYSSYREYLKDYLAEQKKATPPLTLEKLAKKLAMSTSALQMVLKGTRNLSEVKVHDIAFAIGLSDQEEEYFTHLVHFEQAEGKREKRYYEKHLALLKKNKPLEVRRVSLRELLAEWYLPTLLVYLTDLQGPADINRIQKELGLDPGRAQEVLERLEKIGVLKRADEHIHIVYDRVAANFPKEQFLIKVAQEAQKRIKRDFADSDNYFEAHTFTSCPEHYEEFVAEYKNLLKKFIALGAESPETARVYQAFQAFFPTL